MHILKRRFVTQAQTVNAIINPDSAIVSYKYILKFWWPLVATWLMMAFEGPYIAAAIARNAHPEFNLAAHGVAYALALLSESPVIMLMAASTSLVVSADSFYKMRNFTYFLSAAVTALILFGLYPSIFHFITTDIMSLPSEVTDLTHFAMILLIPWPGAIGYRRFLQGVLISSGRTRLISYGTIVRVVVMASTVLLLSLLSSMPGAAIGAAALSAGVCAEALASHFMARNAIAELKLKKEKSGKRDVLSYKKIMRFYYPLALATLIGLGAQPLVTAFVGKSRLAVPSLAALPVVYGLVFIIRSIGLSYHEVVITFLQRNKNNLMRLRRMTGVMFALTVCALALIVFSPASDVWFRTVSGLDGQLAGIAEKAARLMVLMPGLSILISYQRALHVVNGTTKFISMATVIEVSGIGVLMLYFVNGMDMTGAYAAVLALVGGRIMANIFLYFTNHKYQEM